MEYTMNEHCSECDKDTKHQYEEVGRCPDGDPVMEVTCQECFNTYQVL
jgi:hypothetical protein